MRRSRSALTAWPAFADLMTVLAVLGLAIAAGVASVGAPDEDRIRAMEAALAAARARNARDDDRIRALEAQLAAARNTRGGDRIPALQAELTAARERNAALEATIEEAERRELERRLGSVPCLGTRPGSRTVPVPLLRIVVDSGYHLTRLWPPGTNVAGIPRLDEAIAHGLMQEGDLRRYARGMHAYGNADDTYDGPCRFWVELRKGETTSQTTFARALGIVNQYFLLSNSSEVNRILMGTE